MIDGAVVGRKAIDPSAETLDLPGQLRSSFFRGPAEKDMLQDMRQAELFGGLICGPCLHRQLKGDQRRRGVLFCDYSKTVREKERLGAKGRTEAWNRSKHPEEQGQKPQRSVQRRHCSLQRGHGDDNRGSMVLIPIVAVKRGAALLDLRVKSDRINCFGMGRSCICLG